MTIGATLTWIFGLAMVAQNPPIAETNWFLIKFAAVIGLLVYHYRCWLWIRRLRNTNDVQETRWLRWFNEIPTVFLFLIIILAVVKPG